MAARNYNPNSFAISQKVEDVIEHYNNMKNPSGQPLIFHQALPPVIRNREHGHYSDVRLVGGSRRMLAVDATQPMMRPPGMIDSHQAKSGKYVMNGNSATYPVYNAVEQKSIDRSKTRGKSAQLEGEGLWEDMNAWGKQNERNAIALAKDPRVLALVNDPAVQEQAKKLGMQAVDLAKAQLTKKGSGRGRGRGRPRKYDMEGEGIWEDMNAWGKQNEVNFNKFGRDTEAAFKNAGVQMNAWGRANVERVKQALADPRVMAVLNDPAVQKLGKQAVKMAVSYIPVVGPAASQVLGMLGFGKVPGGRGRPRKITMEGEGIWEDMNKWGKQNERNAIALAKDPRVLALVNDPAVQEQAKKLGMQAVDLAKAQLTKKGSGRGRGRPRKYDMEGEGIWEDMNAWGKQNEVNFNKFGRDTEAAFKNAGVQMNAWGRANVERVKQALADPRVMAVLNDPAVQKLGKQAVKMAVSYIPVVGPAASQVLGMLGFGKAQNARAAIVRQIMQEKGLKLTDASKYVKEHNLYKK